MTSMQSAVETERNVKSYVVIESNELDNQTNQNNPEFNTQTTQISEQEIAQQQTLSNNNDNTITNQNETVSSPTENYHSSSNNKGKTKRPPNAYVLFCSDHRSKIQAENPTLTTIDISHILSQMWKDLDAEVVNSYKEKSKALYEEYKQQNPISKYQKKSDKPKKKRAKSTQLDLNPLQVVNHLFQTNSFILQQMVDGKDSKGRFDISKLFLS